MTTASWSVRGTNLPAAAPLPDFAARDALTDPDLLRLWAWSEADFLRLTEGSPIRRIGHVRWLRNLAVALGNALRADPGAVTAEAMRQALQAQRLHPDVMVREHVLWALRWAA